jgi:hypothetical protein
MKHSLRRFVVRKMPPGIALEPFEFSIMLAYIVTSTKLLIELADRSNDVLIKALPFRGLELLAFLVILLAGSLTGAVGLILRGHRPIFFALQVERAGLFLVGGAILTYLAGIINLIGPTLSNLTLVTTAFQLVALLYKGAQISQTIGRGQGSGSGKR